MDQLDKYIEKIVSKKITEPENLEDMMLSAIHTEKGKRRIKRNRITRAILTSLTTIFITTGVGGAGYIAYEKIWKNPERYTYEEIQNTLANVDNVDDIQKAITEEEAKEKATTIMNNLGYTNETIKSIVLEKDINNNNEPFYNIMTSDNTEEGIIIKLSANDGDILSFTNNNFLNVETSENDINGDKAKEYSDKIIQDIGSSEDEYQFTQCIQQQMIYNGQTKKVWVANYCKTYDGIYNPYEVLTTNFIISDNKVEVDKIFEIKDGTYDNNPTVITEDEAIQVAVNKEKELASKEIETVSTEVGIRKMNSYIYALENNLQFSNDEFENEGTLDIDDKKIRKIWMVKITHKNTNENIDNLDANQRLKNANKIYYIDITTAEILGGEEIMEGGI